MPEPTPEQLAELRDWILTRPPNVRAVMDRFPPAAYVQANRPLLVPGLGEEGIVVGYEEHPDGRVDSDWQLALYRQATA